MKRVSDCNELELTKALSYTGYVLVAFELIREMIIGPIRMFYQDVHFINGPFKSYQDDVLQRHKNELEACLLYLKDFMQAIDEHDIETIQLLRQHRNDLTHNIPRLLHVDIISQNAELMMKVKNVVFKISNYRAYIEIGQEPELRGINWDTVKGGEYLILEAILEKVNILKSSD
jgi:hypothetical protein